MSFVVPRFNNNYKWELSRFACIKNTNVVGGFSKLLKHFRKLHCGNIISYSDRCYSSGRVYETNGFTKLKVGKPDYMYIDKNCYKRYPKRQFRKDAIASKFGIDMTNKTETEAMRELGYKRIWDAGKVAWVLQ